MFSTVKNFATRKQKTFQKIKTLKTRFL